MSWFPLPDFCFDFFTVIPQLREPGTRIFSKGQNLKIIFTIDSGIFTGLIL
ncbi:hypothetical protein STEG23_027962, partial [Scotinomys teguina]